MSTKEELLTDYAIRKQIENFKDLEILHKLLTTLDPFVPWYEKVCTKAWEQYKKEKK